MTLTVPVLNATGWQTGAAFLTLPTQAALRVRRGDNGLVSYGESFWVCGDSAYKWLPHGWHGSRYSAILLLPSANSTTPPPPPGRPGKHRVLVAPTRGLIT
ncbi:hypothetical protein G0U57_002225, partial [Chelydra serpentina]